MKTPRLLASDIFPVRRDMLAKLRFFGCTCGSLPPAERPCNLCDNLDRVLAIPTVQQIIKQSFR